MNELDVFLMLAETIKSAKNNDELPNIRVTKISESDKPVHPNNIKDGYVREGKMYRKLTVGESFYVGLNWRTSVVMEILPDGKFRTMNSIYKLEKL